MTIIFICLVSKVVVVQYKAKLIIFHLMQTNKTPTSAINNSLTITMYFTAIFFFCRNLGNNMFTVLPDDSFPQMDNLIIL